MNYSLVAKYLGFIAWVSGVAMVPAICCAAWYGERGAFISFALSIGISAFIGLALWLLGRNARDTMFQRESLALVSLSWILAAGIGALPFILSGTLPNPIDAYFESMSGFTTTGSTVLENIEATSRSVLFWRSTTQWLGGIGIVVLFIVILPNLGAEGKQLFKLEAPGPENPNLRPRIRDTARSLFRLYLGLTLILIVLLYVEGMTLFDAICHAFSTMSTGGFSTRQASLGAFDSVVIELTVVVFMVIAATNFVLFFAAVRDRGRSLWRNAEVRLFLGILGLAIVLIALNLMGLHGNAGPALEAAFEEGYEGVRYENVEQQKLGLAEALRTSIFHTASIMTTTGYVTDDFDLWPHFSRSLLLLLMFVGGCAGSTAGGFKVVRVMMLFKMAYWGLESTFRPKTIRLVRVGEEVVEEQMLRRLSVFFVLYLLWFLLGTMFISLFGLPFETSTTAVIATMNNIGPGLSLVGANVDYHLMPLPVKLLLSFCMVLGRLEIFTISVLFIPGFWRSWTASKRNNG